MQIQFSTRYHSRVLLSEILLSNILLGKNSVGRILLNQVLPGKALLSKILLNKTLVVDDVTPGGVRTAHESGMGHRHREGSTSSVCACGRGNATRRWMGGEAERSGPGTLSDGSWRPRPIPPRLPERRGGVGRRR